MKKRSEKTAKRRRSLAASYQDRAAGPRIKQRRWASRYRPWCPKLVAEPEKVYAAAREWTVKLPDHLDTIQLFAFTRSEARGMVKLMLRGFSTRKMGRLPVGTVISC